MEVKEIESSFELLAKASNTFDNRYISKVLRGIGTLRKKISDDKTILESIISKVYGTSRSYLNQFGSIKESMDVDGDDILPEVDLYIHLLVQIYYLDNKQYDELNSFNDEVIKLMQVYNRRTLDLIQAKIWFYISRTKELIDDLLTIRPVLTTFLKISSLRHDNETMGCIITLLLRNYIVTKDFNQAINLIEKIQFPECSNSVSCRYYYYLAKIHAIQLNYSIANEYCITAIRKSPQTKLSLGFLQSATKLNIIIELLMGDIPELKIFKTNQWNFEPYFMVTKAVKNGDLKLFDHAIKTYRSDFINDDTLSLILRLHQNVIKTGIRLISLSYSKISLKDICIKLNLDSEQSTEYIIAKSIRDNVIEASINNEKGFMKSKELLDIYSTKLPQTEFDSRINFCLELYNDLVKSMRYPSENLKVNEEIDDDELELIKALQDGDLDGLMD